MIEERKMPTVYLQDQKYDFYIMEKQIQELRVCYPFLHVSTIGSSVEGRALYFLSLGTGERKIHVNGSHHANEWITSFALMKNIEALCKAMEREEDFFKNICYDFVPMVNPDGVTLCLNGLESVKNLKRRRALYDFNEGSYDFSRWKANIRGVDLNRNYNAGFKDYGVISEKIQPSYGYYQGSSPESEPESKALADLTRQRHYDMVFAYHTQGEVIYWTYDKINVDNAEEYAKIFEKASGYKLDVPDALAASGGYKDWFIKVFRKPGFTIECGYGENPIDSSQGETIASKTELILLLAAKDIRKEEV